MLSPLSVALSTLIKKTSPYFNMHTNLHAFSFTLFKNLTLFSSFSEINLLQTLYTTLKDFLIKLRNWVKLIKLHTKKYVTRRMKEKTAKHLFIFLNTHS